MSYFCQALSPIPKSQIPNPGYWADTKILTGGQQGQGHEVVLHDQGEGYQQPKTFGSWSH